MIQKSVRAITLSRRASATSLKGAYGLPVCRTPRTFQSEHEQRARNREHSSVAEGDCCSKGGPEHPDNDARKEIAHAVHRSEHAESHAVLLGAHQLGAERIFERLFNRHINTVQDVTNPSDQTPQGKAIMDTAIVAARK